MFFQRISKEVEELGKEMLTYYEEIDVRGNSYFNDNTMVFEFRDIEIFRIKDSKRTFFGEFCLLSYKEEVYIHDCATKSYLKKITFTENKNK